MISEIAKIFENPENNLNLQQQKVDLALKKIDDALKLQEKSKVLTLELKNYYRRLSWALNADFKKYIKDLENSLIPGIMEKQKDRFYKNPKGLATLSARKQIIRESPYTVPGDQGWQNWLTMAKNVHQKDRTEFIKRGDIL